MDKIDYRKDGYWTDHKTTWGIPPAYGLYARHINGLELRNVTFQLANPDQRSAILLNQASDIRISDFTVACDPPDTAVITALDCTGLDISGVTPAPRNAALLRLEGKTSADVVLGENSPNKFTKEVEYADGATEKALIRRRR
jgi:hypothetical protein